MVDSSEDSVGYKRRRKRDKNCSGTSKHNDQTKKQNKRKRQRSYHSTDDESSDKRRSRKHKKKKKEKRRKDQSRETAQRVDVNTDPLPVRVAPNAHHQALPPPRTPMVPMTKAEWERQQAQVKEVYDEESGRYRLVRGSGEIIERIVSRSSHDSINQAATRGDGSSFSRSIFETLKKK
jgi:hypothetical protein